MSFFDLSGTIKSSFQIGIKGAGERIIRFKNAFISEIKWNPTNSQTLWLPDTSGNLSLQPFIGAYDSAGSFSIPYSTGKNYKQIHLNLGSAGGGGGSGRCAISGDRYGGGGGSGGAWTQLSLPLDWLYQRYGNYPIDITIGEGGLGGAAVSGTSDGVSGQVGGFSLVSINGVIILYCLGGNGGSGGTTTTGTGGAVPNYGLNIGTAGGSSSVTANAGSGNSSHSASTGGGAGGGVNAAGNGFGGGQSSAAGRGYTGNNSSVARGISSGGVGTDGAAASISNPVERSFPIPGQGGGGGGAGSTTTGGKGGAGFRGGGGGGGGAGTTASGAGEKGGDGWCLAILS